MKDGEKKNKEMRETGNVLPSIWQSITKNSNSPRLHRFLLLEEQEEKEEEDVHIIFERFYMDIYMCIFHLEYLFNYYLAL